MTNHEPLTNPETDGFPELVYAMHKALVDLLGDQYDIDYDALAPELADTAWKELRRSSPKCVECQGSAVDRHEANPDCCVEMRHCDGCGEDYNAFEESHVGHRMPDNQGGF